MVAEEDRTHVAAWSVDGVRYDVDFDDIDGLEWREVTQRTRLFQSQLMAQALRFNEFEAVAAFIWIVRRRADPGVKYDDILKSLTYRSLRRLDDEEGEPNPPE